MRDQFWQNIRDEMIPLFKDGDLSGGLIKGTSGFGSSLVTIPLLFLAGYTKNEAVTMMITSNIALNVLLMYENRNYFHLETVKKIYPIKYESALFREDFSGPFYKL